MRGSNRANRIVIEYEQKKRWEEKAKRLEQFRKEKQIHSEVEQKEAH